MIQTPETYSDWVNLFEKLKKHEDDESVVAAMERGSIPWQSGVAERFSVKLVEAVNKRLDDANDRFKRNMRLANGEGALIQALNALRKDIVLMKRVVSINAIPPEIREKYVNMVREFADSSQRSLEDSSKNGRTGRLRFIVRNHSVNRI